MCRDPDIYTYHYAPCATTSGAGDHLAGSFLSNSPVALQRGLESRAHGGRPELHPLVEHARENEGYLGLGFSVVYGLYGVLT